MNYRHVFHAGNFADVLKHCVLARLLNYMTGKDKPLRYIDTHAGIGGEHNPSTFDDCSGYCAGIHVVFGATTGSG